MMRKWIFAVIIVAMFGLILQEIWNIGDSSKSYLTTINQPARSVEAYKGNINGIPITVPRTYIYYPVEYKDKSIWVPRKPGDKPNEARTYDDAISAFTVYVRWPDMKPRDQAAIISGRDTKMEPQRWLLTEVGAYSPEAIGRDLGWAPVLAGELKYLSPEGLAKRPAQILDPADPEQRRWIRTHEPRYALRGIDAASGLNWAEPVGPGVERFYTWNMALYWSGDVKGYVSDFISCYNGTVASPDGIQICRHNFNLPEFGASATITYPRYLVPQWRAIRSNIKKLVLSFKSSTDANKQLIKQ